MNRALAILSMTCLALLPGCSLLVGAQGDACTEGVDDCGPGLRCGPEGECIPADCVDACATVGTSCQEDVLYTCSAGASGCLEVTLTDCAQSSMGCVDAGSGAACEGPCSDQCQEPGMSCDGNDLVTCAVGGSGCLEASSFPCAEPDPYCLQADGSASCVPCLDTCEQIGTNCQDDQLVECTQAHSGCLTGQTTDCTLDDQICFGADCVAPDASCGSGLIDGHETGTDCGGPCTPCPNDEGCGEHGDCQSGYCDPQDNTCRPDCSDDCSQADPDQCDGSAIQQCQLSADGCWLWTPTTECADYSEICLDGGCAACPDCSAAGAGAVECTGTVARNCQQIGESLCWLNQECSLQAGTTCSIGAGIATCVTVGSCGTYSCNTRGPGFADMRDDGSGMAVEFVDGQPVVVDTPRGLMWQGCVGGFSVPQCAGGSASYKTWSEARDYCQNLIWGPQAGAPYDDWYLPDRYELQSILQYQGAQWMDPALFPASGSFDLWSSSTDRTSSAHAWSVDSGTGNIFSDLKEPGTGGNYVRCVRRIDPALAYAKRFQIDGDEQTSTDLVTGLIWQRCTSGYDLAGCSYNSSGQEGYAQNQAPNYCSALSLGNLLDGWRLPSAKELNSIVDDTRSPSVDTEAFFIDALHDNADVWTSDSDALGRRFYLDLQHGSLSYDAISSHNVRCVHDP